MLIPQVPRTAPALTPVAAHTPPLPFKATSDPDSPHPAVPPWPPTGRQLSPPSIHAASCLRWRLFQVGERRPHPLGVSLHLFIRIAGPAMETVAPTHLPRLGPGLCWATGPRCPHAQDPSPEAASLRPGAQNSHPAAGHAGVRASAAAVWSHRWAEGTWALWHREADRDRDGKAALPVPAPCGPCLSPDHKQTVTHGAPREAPGTWRGGGQSKAHRPWTAAPKSPGQGWRHGAGN